MNEFTWKVRRLFCDWQMPDFLPELSFDVEYFIRKIVELGGQSIDFTSKSAFGSCLYPSKVGRTNKAMKENYDIFGKVCRLAKEHGLEVIVYYNMLLDDARGRSSTDWLQTDREGNTLAFESYPMFCMNVAPYREIVYRHMEEIASLFEMDGFNLDIQYWHSNGCYCTWCRDKFKSEYGYALDPSLFERQNWFDFYDFQAKSRKDFILGAKERVDRIRPELAWVWNGSGRFSDNEELDKHLTYYGTEAHPPGYDECSTKSKWMRSSGKPFGLWMPESIGSWGHFSVTTPGTLKAMCGIAMANGGAIGVNHVPPPCGDYKGRVLPGVYDLLGKVMPWIKEREEYCMNKTTVPVVAILHSHLNTRIDKTARMAQVHLDVSDSPLGDKALGMQNSLACSKLLNETAIVHDFLRHEGALERITEYETVILPNLGYLDEKTADIIREYVSKGGSVLATYNTSVLNHSGVEHDNFTLSDLFGVDFKCYSGYSVIYVDKFNKLIRGCLPELPILMKDIGYQKNSIHRAIYCELHDSAQAYAYFTEPIIESDWATGYHIYHDHAPPGKKTSWPAVIINSYGKGKAAFLPFAVLQAYDFQPNPWIREIITQTLGVLGSPRKVRVKAPVSVEVVATQDANAWYVHFINIQKETGSMFIDESSHAGPISCTCEPPWTVAGIRNVLTGMDIEFSAAGGEVTFSVPSVKDHEIIELRK